MQYLCVPLFFCFVCITVNNMLALTNSAVDFGKFWRTVTRENALVFKVKACESAYVLLAKYPGVTTYSAYEIRIGVLAGGSTMKTQIRKRLSRQQGPAPVTTPNILECSEFHYFWIEWREGYIGFGKGAIPRTDKVTEWNHGDAQFEVNAISMASPSPMANAKWVFEDLEGKPK